MNAATDSFILGDGRRLAYHQYGEPQGFPIFAFHGLPGSRIWYSEDDQACQQLGIRLITVDRPGFGLSDQKRNRTFLDFADDVKELARFLGISKFSVFGVSGGGVYAAALAYRFPEMVHRCGLISTVNQFEKGKPPKGMAKENRMIFTLSRHFPWLTKWLLKQQLNMLQKKPQQYVDSIRSNTSHLCRSDSEVMESEENAELMLIHMKEAFRNGVEGIVYEARLFSKPWGFSPSEIRVPVELWHGVEDTLSPIEPLRKLTDELTSSNSHFVEGRGHFLTEDASIWEQILMSLKPGSSNEDKRETVSNYRVQ